MVANNKRTNNHIILEQSDLISRKFDLYQTPAKFTFIILQRDIVKKINWLFHENFFFQRKILTLENIANLESPEPQTNKLYKTQMNFKEKDAIQYNCNFEEENCSLTLYEK